MAAEEARYRETVDVLAGARGRQSRGQQAVRVDDLAALLDIPPAPPSASAGSAPTQEEFNALVAHVHFLHRRLAAIAARMQQKKRG